MYQEENKKTNYAAICLLCFCSCLFAFQLGRFSNSYTRGISQNNLVEDVTETITTYVQSSVATSTNAQSSGSADSYGRPQNSSIAGLHTPVESTARDKRERGPSSYSLKIESFSTLERSNYIEDKYETRPFIVGGYNWTFILYPKGNKRDNGSGYISLYVAIDNSSFVNPSQEVYADLKFYVYNKNERKYLTIQETDVWRFNVFKTMWGFSQVLPFDTFNDPRNGYLYDGDHCEFGVDVVVAPLFDKSEMFTVIDKINNPIFTWTVQKFSTHYESFFFSEGFDIGGRQWYFKLYPRGGDTEEGKSLSLFLCLKQQLKPYEKVYLRGFLRIIDQRKSKPFEKYVEGWLYKGGECRGHMDFISFADLRGLIVNDALKVQVELQAFSATKYFPN